MTDEHDGCVVTLSLYHDSEADGWSLEGEQSDMREALELLVKKGKSLEWRCNMLHCGCKFESPIFGEPITACVRCAGLGKYPYISFDLIDNSEVSSVRQLLLQAGFILEKMPARASADVPEPGGAHGRIEVEIWPAKSETGQLRLECFPDAELVKYWLGKAKMGFGIRGKRSLLAAQPLKEDIVARLVYMGCRVFDCTG